MNCLPLSQRLDAQSLYLGGGDNFYNGAEIREVQALLHEAAQLAKRVEAAPTGRVDMSCASDAIVVDELENPDALVKRRVALVTLEEP